MPLIINYFTKKPLSKGGSGSSTSVAARNKRKAPPAQSEEHAIVVWNALLERRIPLQAFREGFGAATFCDVEESSSNGEEDNYEKVDGDGENLYHEDAELHVDIEASLEITGHLDAKLELDTREAAGRSLMDLI
ncbi:hypothetical protein HAX54_005533 [Datura stramonium]|uniref:Uncharacterized protein n=1 Tax=Datura stramonium TaxID=4076 RepID=A0ABS8WTJ3_DATST|nr:hypothetical protein [Datura stramonium]